MQAHDEEEAILNPEKVITFVAVTFLKRKGDESVQDLYND